MAAPPLLLRSRVSFRSISAALKHSKKSIQSELSPFLSNSKSQTSSPSSVERRILLISRLPTDSCCLVSMLPLHSAIAAARLKSVLSAESQNWGLVPQGISMPL